MFFFEWKTIDVFILDVLLCCLRAQGIRRQTHFPTSNLVLRIRLAGLRTVWHVQIHQAKCNYKIRVLHLFTICDEV